MIRREREGIYRLGSSTSSSGPSPPSLPSRLERKPGFFGKIRGGQVTDFAMRDYERDSLSLSLSEIKAEGAKRGKGEGRQGFDNCGGKETKTKATMVQKK